MRDAASIVEVGRRAYAASDWATTFDALASVRSSLDVDDLALLARSAWFLARIPDSIELSEEVFRRYSAETRPADAAATALFLTLEWFARNEIAFASGWMNRSRRLVSGLPDGPLHGYLAYLEGMFMLFLEGRVPEAAIRRLHELATTTGDPVIEALELAVCGVSELRHGDVTRGFAQLDEAMLPVIAGQVPAEWGGDIYCTVIHVCHDLADFARMADWTNATERWCRHFAGEGILPGICRVHRLELRAAHGDWAGAETKLAAESDALLTRHAWIAGAGFYQLGEIRRFRGDSAGAREAYEAARRTGTDPQPGEAMLAFREGHADEAWSALVAALNGRDRVGRAKLLREAVEVAVATDRLEEAAALADEARDIASSYRTPGFAAWADHAEGMVLLAQGRSGEALTALRSAEAAFRRDRQPYEVANVLGWMARAHAGTGEEHLAARLEAEARGILERLGVPTDADGGGAVATGPLTAREAEVLAAVARGAGNRDVAAQLFISEKTVGRHLANIYVKLGVGSRTAAAAWWRDHAAP